MPNRFKSHKNKNDSPSMSKKSHNPNQGGGHDETSKHWHQGKKEGPNQSGDYWHQGKKEGPGKSGEYWQQGHQDGSRNANGNGPEGINNGSGNANGNMDQFPGVGDLTRSGCLPTLFARIKAAFKGGARGGCLPKLSILLLPILAAGVIVLIWL